MLRPQAKPYSDRFQPVSVDHDGVLVKTAGQRAWSWWAPWAHGTCSGSAEAAWCLSLVNSFKSEGFPRLLVLAYALMEA